MRKIYKIDRFFFGRKGDPVYYENIVDLVEDLAKSYYIVYVINSSRLLESIKSLCLIHYPEYFKSVDFFLHDLHDTVISTGFSNLTGVVSEVEVDQDGHLLSTLS